MELSLAGVGKTYGDLTVLHPIDLAVARGEFVTVLGPSGCGKSTLLRILCGIVAPTRGQIVLRGQRIEALPPEKRDIAMVFQSYALFPHLSVAKNLAFGLRMKKVDAAEQTRRIAHAVEICNLGELLQRMPRQLSGGQQQRVALARAIVMQPALLLFDEPLSNLDAKLRDSLRQELLALHKRAGTTSLYVTHDQAEAMTMSDRVAVMNAGRIVEVGAPLELYRAPRHAFTAQFLGQTNLLSLPVEAGRARLPWGDSRAIEGTTQGTARVSIRPEEIAMRPQADAACEVTSVAFAGPQVHYLVRVGAHELRVSTSGGEPLLAVGQRVAVETTATLRALDGEPKEPA